MKWIEYKSNKSTQTDELQQFKFKKIDDCISGRFICFKKNRIFNSFFAIVENDNGKFIINTSTHLKRQLEELTESGMLKPQDNILIRYYKDLNVNKPQKMKCYKVFIEEKEE